MADIKQAALWMREGRMVYRTSITGWRIWKDCHGDLVCPNGYSEAIQIDDILADDWETTE